jgi:ArsR family transcriptional regulator
MLALTNQNERTARIFKAFCDENRLMVLELLKDGEKCANSLLEELLITQSTLSHHMRILCESGMVVSRKQGKWTYYSLSPDGCRDARAQLERIMPSSGNKTA